MTDQPTPFSEGPLPDFVSFDGVPDLLRASSLTQVLGNGGRILRQSTGDETTFALSHPVRSIDAFISHNWSVPWPLKFGALCFSFERRRAVLGSLLLQTVCLFFSSAGFLPSQETSGHFTERRYVACRLVGVPTFLALLLSSPEVKRCLGLRGPHVFLDKTCINQSSKRLQQEGIRKLGAFLCHSRRLVVLFSETYLTRLWTVYEFACFLTIHPAGDIELVSVPLTMDVFKALVFVYLLHVANVILAGFTRHGQRVVVMIVFFLVLPFIGWSLRSAARQQHNFQRQVGEFTVQRCSCACEDDRPLVYHNIAELMFFSKVVSSTATQEEALAAFDIVARSKLQRLIRDVTGRYGCTYSTILTATVFLTIPDFLNVSSQLVQEMHWGEFLANALIEIMDTFVICPCAIALVAILAGWNLHLHGAFERLYIVGSSWLSVVIAWFVNVTMFELMALTDFEFPKEADLHMRWAIGVGGVTMLMVMGIATTVWLFEGWQACVCTKPPVLEASGYPHTLCKKEREVALSGSPGVSESGFEDPSNWEHMSLGS